MERIVLFSGKLFIVLAITLFLAGLISLFYAKTPLVSFSVTEIKTVQATFGSRGTSALSPQVTYLIFIEYSYIVKGKSYKGNAVRFFQIDHLKKNESVYYNPIIPAISVYEKRIPVFIVMFFLILGMGILELRKWVISNVRSY